MEKPKKLTFLQQRKKEKEEEAINRMCNNLLDLKKHNAHARVGMGYSRRADQEKPTIKGEEIWMLKMKGSIPIEELPLFLK